MPNYSSGLPWLNVQLEQICSKPQYGYTTRASSIGHVKFLRTTDITKSQLDWSSVPYCESAPEDILKYQLKDRDIVISRAGSIGFSCLLKAVPIPSVFASYLIRFEPSMYISEVYLKRFLESHNYWSQLALMSAGNAVQNVNAQKLAKINLPLAPLTEQRVIADKLDTLLTKVEKIKARLERIPELLKAFRQSVLSAAVSGKLTKEWREEHSTLNAVSLAEIDSYWSSQYIKFGKKRPNLNIIAPISSIQTPKSWLSTNIGYIFDVYVGATPSRTVEDYWEGSIPWVSSSEVAFCRITSTKETISALGLSKTSTNLHPPGTVMLAMIGQGKTRGQVAILDIQACHNQNTAALRVPSGLVISEYLYFYLVKQYEETRRIGGGNNQQALNKSFVQSLEFLLPPFKEQQEIVRRIEELFTFADSIEQKANAALERVNNLTQSILAKAFRGELTADWRAANPDLISGENSAESLLEKIKAERKALEPAKKTRARKNV
ncbi:restriction endonuclease subunit S [Providencia rettgeri]|uniref:restriction endonuclease subunit S n=1 Tax=Providencia rettgeri TaxID=587 RepID=UPI001EE6939E|nr:restriction endonuclease subunit S [Providencia rettgeri]MCG5279480.1 restriction endonuclease subunit S [Providencia rettgeri]